MLIKEDLKKLFGEEKYLVTIFKEEGFTRRKCKRCGSYFWTLDETRELCGDTACVGGYMFLKDDYNIREMDLNKTIKHWSSYFTKNNHLRIKDYPVVARWRDDIFFTIASITDFQPWVLNGTIDPPAPSLIVAQPCIRFGGKGFCDIDNVGKTGRHLSLFIMGGQHSFNSKLRNLKGYWMNECIQLNYDYIVNELKLPKNQITYKEDVWFGGGNFGPSLEVFYNGLEIVNNVFMQYEVTYNGEYREMEFKVIDVGWGLERLTWLSRKTPNIYEAVFNSIINKLRREAEISIPEELLLEYNILSGCVEVEDSAEDKLIQSKMNNLIKGYEQEIEKLQAIYAIADHLRTFIFALADGAIPSNVGGGYNIRTLLRRVFSLNKTYLRNIDLVEVCLEHINQLKKIYPRVHNSVHLIEDILKIELERYETNIEKGRKYIQSLLEKEDKITEDKMREIYVSKGITPETVREIASALNKQVVIPPSFYLNISNKISEKTVNFEENKLKDYIKNLPATRKLYYEKPYDKKFKAKVIKNILNKYIILDQTLFYPEGGGQVGDTGRLNNHQVIKAFKISDIILHELQTPAEISEGVEVEGEIEWGRRAQLMRNHTGAHILNSAARKMLGKHVWQAGAEKTPSRSRLDITHYKSLTSEEVKAIEKLCNEIILENRKVKIKNLERDRAEKKYGFTIYQGGVVPGRILRIVEIEGWDAEACGGTHVKRTGEIAFLKIINTERIQDGVVRIEYLTGSAALEYIQQQDQELHKISTLLDVPVNQVYSAVEKFYNQTKELKKKVERIQKTISIENINMRLVERLGENELYTGIVEEATIKDLINICVGVRSRMKNAILLLFSKKDGVNIVLMIPENLAKNVNAGLIIKEELKELNVKGGGNPQLGQGVAPENIDIESIIEKVKNTLKNKLNLR
ncbi:MAG: alanine--tRNA ligase [Candidatus Odinarchaeum yellowstonii]|uniref:Alanine--tRNA ligase n=1 Tax=Odinarchaeota yellowstonii (strain LCB_4) TaxID=1841599 RepID=A0AAF0D383_ODILC|nr:MAG: alanine--tRNA ligase [Candidatus Odinarchaeum yellowstonii]